MSEIIVKIIKYKKELIISSIIFILSFGIFIFIKFNYKNPINEVVTVMEELNIDEKDEFIENPLIAVDIKGEVNKPGIYLVNENLRVNDIIVLAGGLTEGADSKIINLAKKVFDEMVIIIYSKEESKDMIKTLKENEVKNEKCLEYQEIILNDACIEIPETTTKTNLVNLNKASKEELMTLTGIGESKAISIINYREEVGLFVTIEDIMKVSGIGEAIFVKIKNFITI
ncbi:MAG: hypothetical protein GX861_00185 [Tenericutes bacterium]|jgi:competence protein ComEA|nr:hypothetical protein [Mycoplasmatota bacterium]